MGRFAVKLGEERSEVYCREIIHAISWPSTIAPCKKMNTTVK